MARFRNRLQSPSKLYPCGVASHRRHVLIEIQIDVRCTLFEELNRRWVIAQPRSDTDGYSIKKIKNHKQINFCVFLANDLELFLLKILFIKPSIRSATASLMLAGSLCGRP
jgi:hypothetical protein